MNNKSLFLTISNYFGQLTFWKNFCGCRSHTELNLWYMKWTSCTLQWKFSHVSWDFVAFCSSDGCVVSEYDSSAFRNLNYIELLLRSLQFCGVLFCCCQHFVAKTCTVSCREMVSYQCVSECKDLCICKDGLKKKQSILIFRWKTLTYAALCLIPNEGMLNQPVGSISENCLKLSL